MKIDNNGLLTTTGNVSCAGTLNVSGNTRLNNTTTLISSLNVLQG